MSCCEKYGLWLLGAASGMMAVVDVVMLIWVRWLERKIVSYAVVFRAQLLCLVPGLPGQMIMTSF